MGRRRCGIDEALVASIPPGEKVPGLSVMFPAMNVEDRTELVEGMQAGAPPEVFAGVWAWPNRCSNHPAPPPWPIDWAFDGEWVGEGWVFRTCLTAVRGWCS